VNTRKLRILILAVIGTTLPLHPVYSSVAEISHNFSDFIHISGAQEGERDKSVSGLSPLDQLIKDYLGDPEAPGTFLTTEEDEDHSLIVDVPGFWTSKKIWIGGGLLLASGLLLGILALAFGQGGSSAGSAASGGASGGSSGSGSSNPAESPLPSLPSNLSQPGGTEGDPDVPNDDKDHLPVAGGGGPGDGGENVNNLLDLPEGNPNGNSLFSGFSSEEGTGSGTDSGHPNTPIPHSPEPSTLFLSALGLLIPILRRHTS